MKRLADLRILITRPQGQGIILREALEKIGADVAQHPTLIISPPADPAAVVDTLVKQPSDTLWLFVSPIAVKWFFKLLEDVDITLTRAAAVGEATAREIRKHTQIPIVVPDHGQGATALLEALDETKTPLNHCAVIRGEGGLTVLQAGLRERDTELVDVIVYRRGCPIESSDAFQQLWADAPFDAVIITSMTGLDNMVQMLGDHAIATLQETTIFVVSERVKRRGLNLGLNKIVCMDEAEDAKVYEFLTSYYD